jgi:hypothetical protein
VARPLFDFIADFTAGPPGVPGANAVSLNAAAGTRTQNWHTQRGRQYELGNAEAGMLTVNVFDRAENLNPVSTTSPWNTGGNTLLPYRCIQRHAFWNPSTNDLTGNILNAQNPAPGQPALSGYYAGQTYGYDPSFEQVVFAFGLGGSATFVVDGTHPDGSLTVWQATMTGVGDSVNWSLRVQAGVTYTVKVDMWAAVGVNPRFGWSGTVPTTTTITGNGAYQTATLTITPQGLSDRGLLFVDLPTGTYPKSLWVSNIRTTGLMPGWVQSAGAAMGYATAQAHTGQYSNGVTFAASTDTAKVPAWTVPGVSYTMSAYVYASTTGTVASMTVGASTVSTSSVNTWQRLSITFTATAAVTYVTWKAPSASPYPATVYVDDLQLEIAASASAYTASGPKRYTRYTGYIERYPLVWTDAGFRGMRPLEAVDALSVLSRTVINQSYQQTVLADSPVVYIPYDDKSSPQAVQLPQGGQPTLGYTSLGTNGQVTFSGDTFLDGSPAISLMQQNLTGVTGNTTFITYQGTTLGSLTMNPQAFTIEIWVKVSSGGPYFGAGSVPASEDINVEAFGPTYGIGWSTFISGPFGWYYSDPNGNHNNGGLPGNVGWPDGQWHYLAIKLIGSNGLTAVADNYVGGIATITPSAAVELNNFYLNAQTYWSFPQTQISAAHLACYPYALSNAQLLAHYQRGVGYINEVSGARVARLLSAYWSSTGYSAAAGYAMMAPDFGYAPVGDSSQPGQPAPSARSVLDVVQEITATENGFLYVNGAGTVVWEDRSSRYGQQTSTATIGNGASQIHPDLIEYDYDPTYVYSQVNLGRPANSTFAPQVNSTSLTAYGQRILSASLQLNSDFDLNEAAKFFLNRYAKPGGAAGLGTGPRIRKLTIDVASDPTRWTFVLGLELSQRITVTMQTSAGTVVTGDYYVESIAESGDPSTGSYSVELQCSPVFVPTAWILGDSTYGVLGTTTVPVY